MIVDFGPAPTPVDHRDLLLAAIGAAGAVASSLATLLRDGEDLPERLFRDEAATDLADGLQSVLLIALTAPEDTMMRGDPQRREALGQLCSAVTRFLEGWA